MSSTLTKLAPPTRVRYGVLAFAAVLSMVTYMDRVCISNVARFIQLDFGLTDTQLGYVLSAFILAYALFEIPSGWLGDVFGARRMLVRIVVWWSVFTALTGLIYPIPGWPYLSFVLLVGVRFLFGMGEAGAYPTIARAFHSWFPVQERGFAQGTVWMAGRFAGGITPFLVSGILITVTTAAGTTVHWRHIFWVFGCIGLLWCGLFWFWYRDRPEEKAGINQAELDLIRAGRTPEAGHFRVPWVKILTSVNLWLLCLMYFCGAYGWYFNITWLPKYLAEHYGVTDQTWGYWTTSLLSGAPLLFGSLACLVGGLLTDRFIRRTGNRKWGRRLFGVLGHGLCAVSYFFAIFARNPWLFVLAIALASFWNDITMGSAWASCIDIGRRYSGIVSGFMNTVGNLGGFMATRATGLILDAHAGPARHDLAVQAAGTVASNLGSFGLGVPLGGLDQVAGLHLAARQLTQASHAGWQVNFISFTAVYVVATLCWLFFDATRPVAGEAQ
jgi:nitrate/nitrite transporter NarK